jgi:hypothetical protein
MIGARGGAVGWGTALQAGRSRVRFSMDVFGIFHWHNPSGRAMALGLIQPQTEMSTRILFRWVMAAGAYGWQPYHFHVPIVLKCGSLKLLEPSGSVQGLLYLLLLLLLLLLLRYFLLWFCIHPECGFYSRNMSLVVNYK